MHEEIYSEGEFTLDPYMVKALNQDDVDQFQNLFISISNVNSRLSPIHIYDPLLRSRPPILSVCIYAGARNIVHFLLMNGADIQLYDSKGRLPLHFAACSGNTDLVVDLLQFGCDMNSTDFYQRNVLHYAAEFGCYETVILMFTYGFDLTSRHYRGWTPLHFSAWNNSIGIAKFLLENGADPEVESTNNETPLQFALYNKFNRFAKLLLKYGAKPEGRPETHHAKPLIWCVKSDNVEGIQLLMKYKINLEITNEFNETALEVALRSNRLKAAEYLIDHGAKITNNAKESTMMSPAARNLVKSKLRSH